MESLDTNQKIFQQISDLLAAESFAHANMSFFEENCDKFTDDEENKLEYTPIHEEYIQACEQTIESTLNEKFQQAEVEAFYIAFPSLYPQFLEKNKDTCEIL